MTILVSGAPRGLGAKIRRAVRVTLQAHGRERGRMEVAVVDAAEMRRQHKQWMGRGTVTDVLSFDLRDRGERGRVDGQLMVCEAVARRVARLHDTDWRGELILYVVHGCLHLCGYDDHGAGDFAKMHQQEDRLLGRLGWGPVFSGSSAGKPAGGPRARRSRRGRA